MKENKNKLLILKKTLGKRFAVITDYAKLEHYYGHVESIVDENTVIIKDDENQQQKASIFDLRNPAQEL